MARREVVWILTETNFPFGGAGANYIRLLARGLKLQDLEVRVLIQGGRSFGNIEKETIRRGTYEGINYFYTGFKNRPENYLLKAFDDWLSVISPLIKITSGVFTRQPDYLIIYNSTSTTTVLPLLFARLFHIPVFKIIPEWYDCNSYGKSLPQRIKRTDFHWGMKFFNKKYTGLIVLSTYLHNYYINHKVKEPRLLILPNLIDCSVYDLPDKKEEKDHSNCRIGYCGTPNRKDGILDLLAAVKIVVKDYPKAELLIIGDSPGKVSLVPGIREYAQKLGIADRIHFTGLVHQEKIPELLHRCDILVLARPSGVFAEAGFPTKLGEYLACKKPVVITKVGDIPKYLTHQKNAMLAEPNQPGSVAEQIIYLIQHPTEAKEIGNEGYHWVANHLDYQNKAAGLIRFMRTFKKNTSIA